MADISHIKINGETLDIKDEIARKGGGIRVETASKKMAFDANEITWADVPFDGEPKAALNAWASLEGTICAADEIGDGRVRVKGYYGGVGYDIDSTVYVNLLYID